MKEFIGALFAALLSVGLLVGLIALTGVVLAEAVNGVRDGHLSVGDGVAVAGSLYAVPVLLRASGKGRSK